MFNLHERYYYNNTSNQNHDELNLATKKYENTKMNHLMPVWLYYLIATSVFIVVCYIIGKMINEEGTYVIKTKDGEVLDSCRSKALANRLLKHLRKIERSNDLEIVREK